ncbi:hypothetical protein HELRODRAFT_178936 [Helobdella robusta]|uniref:Ig-like domain-containing protein n=1 Tax=Helobdella robusta TaxID=6412 RepID=T1FDX5_HELRO|nr:hypothetical protein HELRODRAFT_178936 [Helobdella robusta]ESN95756.1 hypothetical protein HELRODRAFT_178936 [Helobdella robusta]
MKDVGEIWFNVGCKNLTGNLYIAHVEVADSMDGRHYVCLVKNNLLDRFLKCDGHIIRPVIAEETRCTPTKIKWTSPEVDYAIEGGNKTLKCIFSGRPTPTVTWTRLDGRPLNCGIQNMTSPSEGHKLSQGLHTTELFINHVTADCSGVYVCEAASSAGDGCGHPMEKRLELIVESPPHWMNIQSIPPIIEAKEGQEVILNIEVQGQPAPDLIWMANGNVLPANNRTSIDKGHLRLVNVTSRDIQIVQLRASNKHGSILTSIIINVKAPTPTPLDAILPFSPTWMALVALPVAICGVVVIIMVCAYKKKRKLGENYKVFEKGKQENLDDIPMQSFPLLNNNINNTFNNNNINNINDNIGNINTNNKIFLEDPNIFNSSFAEKKSTSTTSTKSLEPTNSHQQQQLHYQQPQQQQQQQNKKINNPTTKAGNNKNFLNVKINNNINIATQFNDSSNTATFNNNNNDDDDGDDDESISSSLVSNQTVVNRSKQQNNKSAKNNTNSFNTFKYSNDKQQQQQQQQQRRSSSPPQLPQPLTWNQPSPHSLSTNATPVFQHPQQLQQHFCQHHRQQSKQPFHHVVASTPTSTLRRLERQQQQLLQQQQQQHSQQFYPQQHKLQQSCDFPQHVHLCESVPPMNEQTEVCLHCPNCDVVVGVDAETSNNCCNDVMQHFLQQQQHLIQQQQQQQQQICQHQYLQPQQITHPSKILHLTRSTLL